MSTTVSIADPISWPSPRSERCASTPSSRPSRARVVSMPSWELFDAQPAEYRDEVLPPSVSARVAIEQGSAFGGSGTSARTARSWA